MPKSHVQIGPVGFAENRQSTGFYSGEKVDFDEKA